MEMLLMVWIPESTSFTLESISRNENGSGSLAVEKGGF